MDTNRDTTRRSDLLRPTDALPPDIIAVLRRTAQETLARHIALLDGRCSYCAATWQHTHVRHPCPPVRIALQFLHLTQN